MSRGLVEKVAVRTAQAMSGYGWNSGGETDEFIDDMQASLTTALASENAALTPAAEAVAVGRMVTLEDARNAVISGSLGEECSDLLKELDGKAVLTPIVPSASHSTQENYEHFLAYSGFDDNPLLRYAYFHGADVGLEKPSTPPAQQGEVERLREALGRIRSMVDCFRFDSDADVFQLNDSIVITAEAALAQSATLVAEGVGRG